MPSWYAAAGNDLAPATSGIEDLREKAELQKAYYSFLHAITSSNLRHVLLQTPSDTLQPALGALVAGGAGHIDPGIRKTCLQVWAESLSDCMGPELHLKNGRLAKRLFLMSLILN